MRKSLSFPVKSTIIFSIFFPSFFLCIHRFPSWQIIFLSTPDFNSCTHTYTQSFIVCWEKHQLRNSPPRRNDSRGKIDWFNHQFSSDDWVKNRKCSWNGNRKAYFYCLLVPLWKASSSRPRIFSSEFSLDLKLNCFQERFFLLLVNTMESQKSFNRSTLQKVD